MGRHEKNTNFGSFGVTFAATETSVSVIFVFSMFKLNIIDKIVIVLNFCKEIP